MSCDNKYATLIDDIFEDGIAVHTRNSLCKRLDTILLTFRTTPLVSVRKTAWKTALREWEWFMSGSNALTDLHPSVHPWWQEWADANGRVAYNYSRQFRYFHGADETIDPERPTEPEPVITVDQVALFVDGIKNHPHSRRNILTTWNTAEMTHKDCKLTNCHNTLTQAFVDDKNRLSLTTYQRSVDVVCGLPHNWIQMWAFLMWLAHRTGRRVGALKWIGGDVHVYDAHTALAAKITDVVLENDALSDITTPNLVYTPTSDDFKADDFTLDGPYEPLITDKAEMIV